MKPKTILLTGAGGIAIPFIVKSLQAQGYRVLAADMDEHAIGLLESDAGFVIPKADDPGFFDAVKSICKRECVDVIVPLVDEELVALSGLERHGVIPLLPRTPFIKTCLDKYQLVRELNGVNILTPKTTMAYNFSKMKYPCIVKPRVGRGSRGVELLKTIGDFYEWDSRDHTAACRYIIQEYLPGTEYTVSVIAWRDGDVQVVVPKEIIVKKGVTKIAVTRRNTCIEDYCTTIQNRLRADGPFNVQLRFNADGQPVLFEINPRYSTTASLTIAAGIDEIHGLIQQALYGRDAYKFGEWREGITLMRESYEKFVDEELYLKLYQNIRKLP